MEAVCGEQTSDGADRHHPALHHVVQVEHLVPQAGGDHCLSVPAEPGLVDGEPLQVDALNLRVCLPVHLKENRVRVTESHPRASAAGGRRYLEQRDGPVQPGRHDHLSGGVELHGGQPVLRGTGAVGVKTLLHLRDAETEPNTTGSTPAPVTMATATAEPVAMVTETTAAQQINRKLRSTFVYWLLFSLLFVLFLFYFVASL